MAMNIPGFGWAKPGSASFQLGKGKTLAVPMALHAAARGKICKIFRDRGTAAGIVLLKGGDEVNQYDSDIELVFRQDSWFNYLFGTKEPGMYGAISISTGRSVLFVPKLSEDYEIWCGKIHPPGHFKDLYSVDDVQYTCDISAWLEQALASEGEVAGVEGAAVAGGAQVHLIHGQNSDSGLWATPAQFAGLEELTAKGLTTTNQLFHVLSSARVTKSEYEIAVMWYSAWVASNAHVEVMRTTRVGMIEYETEAKFAFEIYKKGGCRLRAYTSICACGPNAAVLHYGHAAAPNDRTLLDTDMALLDMGSDYHGYVSDITCSFPVSGKFSADQRVVYEAVLSAQSKVLEHMRPGVEWPHCHRIAEMEIISGLQKAGVIRPEFSVEEIAAAGVGAVFFPHGLGHLIGCDTHDVGGYIDGTPNRPEAPGQNRLRTARVLEAGMVLTNEPGCYFIDALIDAALADPVRSKYLNSEVVARFRGSGGVRLEDVIVVTEYGPPINLTSCPRTVAEVEGVMSGAPWPPTIDEAPYLRRKWGALAPGGVGMIDIKLS